MVNVEASPAHSRIENTVIAKLTHTPFTVQRVKLNNVMGVGANVITDT